MKILSVSSPYSLLKFNEKLNLKAQNSVISIPFTHFLHESLWKILLWFRDHFLTNEENQYFQVTSETVLN